MIATEEQVAALHSFRQGHSMVLEAGAGTGKTTTLKMLGESRPRADGLYLAYNKAIQLEADGTFPSNVMCRTAHSQAYAAVGKYYRDRMNGNRPRIWDVADWLGCKVVKLGDCVLTPNQCARLAKEMVDGYANSADKKISKHHTPYVDSLHKGADHDSAGFDHHDELADLLLPWANQIWEDLQKTAGGQAEFTHDHYLKMWGLTEPQLSVDFVLFDEAQDANPVIADIVSKQNCQKVFVGDRAQAIYGWRGAVDAMSSFPADSNLPLSQSFRFGQELAQEANLWLDQLPYALRLTGRTDFSTTIGPCAKPDAILCRTNGGAMGEVFGALDAGEDPHLVGGTSNLRAFVEGAKELMRGKPSKHRDLWGYKSWAQFTEHAQLEKGELSVWAGIVDTYGTEQVGEALDSCVNEDEADVIISTAHKAKGREWPTVQLADDFAPKKRSLSQEEKDAGVSSVVPFTPADIMLRYVAITRAMTHLDDTALRSKKDHSEVDTGRNVR